MYLLHKKRYISKSSKILLTADLKFNNLENDTFSPYRTAVTQTPSHYFLSVHFTVPGEITLLTSRVWLHSLFYFLIQCFSIFSVVIYSNFFPVFSTWSSHPIIYVYLLIDMGNKWRLSWDNKCFKIYSLRPLRHMKLRVSRRNISCFTWGINHWKVYMQEICEYACIHVYLRISKCACVSMCMNKSKPLTITQYKTDGKHLPICKYRFKTIRK